jgi:glutamate-5-semialdehyde dehydrogenase
MKNIRQIGADAKKASISLASLSTLKKNSALKAIASALVENIPYILRENETDIKIARENGIKESLTDRLMLNEKRIIGIAEGVKQVAELNDPIGEILNMTKRPNGLLIGKMRVPLGVIAII